MSLKSLFFSPSQFNFRVSREVRRADLGIVKMSSSDVKRYIWAGITNPCVGFNVRHEGDTGTVLS